MIITKKLKQVKSLVGDITEEDLPILANMVIDMYPRLIKTNPMDISFQEVVMIYKEVI